MINFPGCIVSPQESPKFSRLEKFKDLTNLTDTSNFITSKDILNMYLDDKFPILHCSLSGSL